MRPTSNKPATSSPILDLMLAQQPELLEHRQVQGGVDRLVNTVHLSIPVIESAPLVTTCTCGDTYDSLH